tara:strand:- start:77646 stop:78428 length:783 start_codon:yes stop_codon:yes gene_type:complete
MLGSFFSYTNIHALMVRYFMEYRQLAKVLLLGDVLERVIFFIAFGFGLGRAVNQIAGVDYMTFLAPGIAAGSGLFVMLAATTYGAHNRYSSARIWQSWLATPIKLQDLLFAEILFPSIRALPSLLILYMVAYGFGAIPSVSGALLSIPILLLANLVYGVITLAMAGLLGRLLYFKYIQSLWIMPMYLFSGVFFNLDDAPVWLSAFAQIFPLTHVLEIVRPMVLGQNVELFDVLSRLCVLFIIFVIGFYFAFKFFKRRLFD